MGPLSVVIVVSRWLQWTAYVIVWYLGPTSDAYTRIVCISDYTSGLSPVEIGNLIHSRSPVYYLSSKWIPKPFKLKQIKFWSFHAILIVRLSQQPNLFNFLNRIFLSRFGQVLSKVSWRSRAFFSCYCKCINNKIKRKKKIIFPNFWRKLPL